MITTIPREDQVVSIRTSEVVFNRNPSMKDTIKMTLEIKDTIVQGIKRCKMEKTLETSNLSTETTMFLNMKGTTMVIEQPETITTLITKEDLVITIRTLEVNHKPCVKVFHGIVSTLEVKGKTIQTSKLITEETIEET